MAAANALADHGLTDVQIETMRLVAEGLTNAEIAERRVVAVKSVENLIARIAKQLDIGNDGEQQRVGFQTYVPQRMTGFAGISKRRRGQEFEEFPELVATLMRRRSDILAVVLAGGPKAFSAGADLGGIRRLDHRRFQMGRT